jgi:hypothetical protein
MEELKIKLLDDRENNKLYYKKNKIYIYKKILKSKNFFN